MGPAPGEFYFLSRPVLSSPPSNPLPPPSLLPLPPSCSPRLRAVPLTRHRARSLAVAFFSLLLRAPTAPPSHHHPRTLPLPAAHLAARAGSSVGGGGDSGKPGSWCARGRSKPGPPVVERDHLAVGAVSKGAGFAVLGRDLVAAEAEAERRQEQESPHRPPPAMAGSDEVNRNECKVRSFGLLPPPIITIPLFPSRGYLLRAAMCLRVSWGGVLAVLLGSRRRICAARRFTIRWRDWGRPGQ